MYRLKTFIVKRDSGKRGDVDKSFLLVKTDVIQNLLIQGFLFIYREMME